jgi:hypothetical protein
LSGGEKASLFAVFRTNIAQAFAPQLQATAMLFNVEIQRDGKVVVLPLERIMALEATQSHIKASPRPPQSRHSGSVAVGGGTRTRPHGIVKVVEV